MVVGRYVTTAKAPDGVYFGAAWREDGSIIAISGELPTRSKARSWAQKRLKQ
jgi:hypothetical protein